MGKLTGTKWNHAPNEDEVSGMATTDSGSDTVPVESAQATPDTKALREAIKQCFVNSFMEHDGELELFDTDKTIELLEELITAQKIALLEKLKKSAAWIITDDHMTNYERAMLRELDSLINQLKERG